MLLIINKLTSLEELENVMNLTELQCRYNTLTSLQGIENLRYLRVFWCENNPIDHIPPNIERILDRMDNGQNLYGDAQNVHNHSIQESIRILC